MMKLTTRLLFCLSIALAACTTDQSKNKQQVQQQTTEIASNAVDMRKSDRIDALMQTLSLAEEAGIQDSSTALIYHQAAIYWYKKANNQAYQKALGLFDKALAIRKKVLQPNDVIFAKNYLNIGKCQKYLLMFSPAIDNFNNALQHYQRQADTISLMEVYRELGETYDEIGDYTVALDYFKQSANFPPLTDKNKTNEQAYQLAQTHYLAGISNINFREFLQAETCFLKALPILESLEDSVKIARVYHELGMTKRFQGLFSVAFNFLNRALRYNMSNKEKTATRIEIVKTHLAAKQLNEAQNAAKQILSVSKAIDKKQLSEVYDAIGTVKMAQQTLDSALFFYQKALQALVLDFTNDDVFLNPSINPKTFGRKIELINVLAHKIDPLSILYKKTKNQRCLEAALQTCLLADSVAQVLRREMRADQSKYFWNETALPIYRKGIDLAAQLYTINPKEAHQLAVLQFAERTKAPVLREGIADNQAKAFAGVPTIERQRERALQATIALLEQQTPVETHSEITAFLAKTRVQLYAFQDSLKTKYPTYARYLDASIQDRPLSINDLEGIQNKLSDSTLLIEYAFGETDLYQIAISNIDFKLFKQPFSAVINAKINRFSQSVSGDFLRKDFNTASRAYAETSFDLYQYLLETPLTQTAHKTQQSTFKRIHLVLEGPLQLLSFKALTDKRVEGFVGNYTQHFLVRQYAFSTLFSSQMLLQKTPSVVPVDTAHLKIACFAVDFKDSTLWLKKTLKTAAPPKKNNALPYAESEGTSITRQFNGRFFLNQEATKDIFIKEAANYDILHITTHGDPDGLVFQKTNANDSLYEVTHGDIYSLPLHTQLTFLSACETGQGKLTQAESVMSLGRAFTYAGSQAVIMSLWSVPDYSTSKIAQQFYTYYHQGLPKDIAEQRAELYFLDKEAQSALQLNPTYWAAFMVNGDMSPLETRATTTIKWWMWGLLGCASMAAVYLYQKKK